MPNKRVEDKLEEEIVSFAEANGMKINDCVYLDVPLITAFISKLLAEKDAHYKGVLDKWQEDHVHDISDAQKQGYQEGLNAAVGCVPPSMSLEDSHGCVDGWNSCRLATLEALALKKN